MTQKSKILVSLSIITALFGLAGNFILGIAIYELWTYDRGPMLILAVILLVLMINALSWLGRLIARLTYKGK